LGLRRTVRRQHTQGNQSRREATTRAAVPRQRKTAAPEDQGEAVVDIVPPRQSKAAAAEEGLEEEEGGQEGVEEWRATERSVGCSLGVGADLMARDRGEWYVAKVVSSSIGPAVRVKGAAKAAASKPREPAVRIHFVVSRPFPSCDRSILTEILPMSRLF
jgi:hypothetical protein